MNYPGLESLKYYLGFTGEPLVEPVLYRYRTGTEPVQWWYRYFVLVYVQQTIFNYFYNLYNLFVKINLFS